MHIPFRREDSFEYGAIQEISPLIRRIVARNPNRFTFQGTGTYIVGRGEVAVIDPGPELPEHIEVIQQSLKGEDITHIVVTHTHRDHSPASRPLQVACSAPIYGFGRPERIDKEIQKVQVEESVDTDFIPDVPVQDSGLVSGNGWTLECVHTPGHTSDHICYRFKEEKALFCGDHVMGWSTSVIVPPDGSMSAYMESLKKLLSFDDLIYYPTHGPNIQNPKVFVNAYIQHRLHRESQIIDCLKAGYETIGDMVPVIYSDIGSNLQAAAAQSMFAAILKLVDEGRVGCSGIPALESVFRVEK